MPYLVDTDWLIDRLTGRPEAIDLLDRLAKDGIALSVVTYMETYQGILRSSDPAGAEQQLHQLLSVLPLLPFSVAVARTLRPAP